MFQRMNIQYQVDEVKFIKIQSLIQKEKPDTKKQQKSRSPVTHMFSGETLVIRPLQKTVFEKMKSRLSVTHVFEKYVFSSSEKYFFDFKI